MEHELYKRPLCHLQHRCPIVELVVGRVLSAQSHQLSTGRCSVLRLPPQP